MNTCSNNSESILSLRARAALEEARTGRAKIGRDDLEPVEDILDRVRNMIEKK